ncbi:MAG: GNAT family N-acetyltransferase [Sphingomonadaceae bacterium]
MTIIQEMPHRLQLETGASMEHPGTLPRAFEAAVDGEVDAQKNIEVCLIHSGADRELAEQLINRMYAWRGYGSNHRLPTAEHCMTFIAYAEENVVGTLTLTVDSPDGLALDHTFANELAEFRAMPGSRICELSKFAFDPSIQSKTVLAAMFHTIFIHGSKFNCTDLFIEVNPRHRRFYEAMLGFKRIGAVKSNDAVGAPSQLMWVKVASIRQNIEQSASGNICGGRSFYPFFFPTGQENGIRISIPACPQEQHLI